MDIKIIVLASGERAPQSADWISIETLPKGRYNVAGCVAGEHQIAFANEMFKSFEDAKLAGVFWARHLGSTTIYVESSE